MFRIYFNVRGDMKSRVNLVKIKCARSFERFSELSPNFFRDFRKKEQTISSLYHFKCLLYSLKFFLRELFIPTRPNLNLDDQPLSTVYDCLFSMEIVRSKSLDFEYGEMPLSQYVLLRVSACFLFCM
jgi:hypothetical protein